MILFHSKYERMTYREPIGFRLDKNKNHWKKKRRGIIDNDQRVIKSPFCCRHGGGGGKSGQGVSPGIELRSPSLQVDAFNL